MKQKRSFLLLTIFILITALCFSYIIENLINISKSPTEKGIRINNESQKKEYFILEKVVDGDTIKIKSNTNDSSKTIRMIGLDAPEKSTTRYGYIECFGEQASKHLQDLLSGESLIELEYDQTQSLTDKYGRTLAYVILSGIIINQKMIEDGYGFEYTYNLPYKYQTDFKKSENYAKINNLGLRSPDNCNGERIPIE